MSRIKKEDKGSLFDKMGNIKGHSPLTHGENSTYDFLTESNDDAEIKKVEEKEENFKRYKNKRKKLKEI